MSSERTPITVIGAGSWGTALALLLAGNGNPTRIWGNDIAQMRLLEKQRENKQYLPGFPFPDNLEVFTELKPSLSGVHDLLIAVPSHAFHSVLVELAQIVDEDVRIAWGTKGLDPETKQLMHQLVARVFSKDTAVAVLAGPSFAKEVAAQLPSAVSLAGNNPQFLQDLIKRFHNKYFRVYINDDLVGVELCGALKNILAIAVGIADGLGLGANTRAALITRGLAEMARLNEALGGRTKTLLSLAGVGDLVLTCTDNQSRNRRFGLAVGQGVKPEQARQDIGQEVEGYLNTRQVYELAKSLSIDIPIIEGVYEALYLGQSPQAVLEGLLGRVPKKE